MAPPTIREIDRLINSMADRIDRPGGIDMHTRRHPLSGAIYDVEDDGLVRVDKAGTVGWFTADGDWVRGELRDADPHLCLWLAGAQIPASLARNPKDLQPTTATTATTSQKEVSA